MDPTFDIKQSKKVIILDNGKDFEGYLIESGYINEVIQAVNEVEDNDKWFEEYMRKNDGTDGRKKQTDEICPKCNQNIYESKKRDYSGDEGIKKALYDCLSSGKTRFGRKIAEVISNLDGKDKSRRFPPKVKKLFEKISAEFNFKINEGKL